MLSGKIESGSRKVLGVFDLVSLMTSTNAGFECVNSTPVEISPHEPVISPSSTLQISLHSNHPLTLSLSGINRKPHTNTSKPLAHSSSISAAQNSHPPSSNYTMPLFFTTPPLFPFTPATTPPPRTTDSTTPTYFTAIQSHLSATGQKAHQIALRNFGQPYATLADRISQTLWIVGVLLDRYPTAKVLYNLKVLCLI